MTAKGEAVKVSPASLTIVQGLTLSDPPLSRSVGVAQADDTVREYFRRGAPLPARRTHVHHTVESVAKGASSVLKVPIVQGEFDQAHLCRLVGTLEISGAATTASLPAGSAVEVTLELDRGGRLTASGYVPALKQVFSQVAHLLVPDASPEALEASLLGLSDRLAHLPAIQFDRHRARFTGEIGDDAEGLIEEARKDIAAARGGDADAAQKAKRTLLELDARLEKLERAQHWPELDAQAQESFASASSWVSRYGTPQEQKYLAEAGEALERARKAQDVAELQRQLRLVGNLSNAAYYRHPEVWKWSFERAASRVNDSTDLPKAQGLVARGRAAIESGDLTPLRAIVEQLWRLLPVDVQNRRKGHESGVR
jgi:molecular chaperone DnaK